MLHARSTSKDERCSAWESLAFHEEKSSFSSCWRLPPPLRPLPRPPLPFPPFLRGLLVVRLVFNLLGRRLPHPPRWASEMGASPASPYCLGGTATSSKGACLAHADDEAPCAGPPIVINLLHLDGALAPAHFGDVPIDVSIDDILGREIYQDL